MPVDSKKLRERVLTRDNVRLGLERTAERSIVQPCLIFLEQFEPEVQEAILRASNLTITTADDGSDMKITLELKKVAES